MNCRFFMSLLLFCAASLITIESPRGENPYEEFKEFQTRTQRIFKEMQAGTFTAWDSLEGIIGEARSYSSKLSEFSVWEAGYANRHRLRSNRLDYKGYDAAVRDLHQKSQTMFGTFVELFSKINGDESSEHANTTGYLKDKRQENDFQRELAVLRERFDKEHEAFFAQQKVLNLTLESSAKRFSRNAYAFCRGAIGAIGAGARAFVRCVGHCRKPKTA